MSTALRALKKNYPDAHCALIHENSWQLLIATMLSAQCTDDMVNKVTPVLFEAYTTPEALGGAPIGSVEKIVRPTGFYKNKARAIKQTSQDLVDRYKSEVPRTMEELIELRGVGRKTANVVLGNAFNINFGVVVDTHVGRLSRRMGFTAEKDPIKVEQDLMGLVPQEDWTLISHLFISHGRALCSARKPLCDQCFLKRSCPKNL